MAIAFALLTGAVLLALGYIGGTDLGTQVATVTSAQREQTWKSTSPETRIHAVLADGTKIYATSPHTPPPLPGDKIVLRVRKTIFGWHSYTWQPQT